MRLVYYYHVVCAKVFVLDAPNHGLDTGKVNIVPRVILFPRLDDSVANVIVVHVVRHLEKYLGPVDKKQNLSTLGRCAVDYAGQHHTLAGTGRGTDQNLRSRLVGFVLYKSSTDSVERVLLVRSKLHCYPPYYHHNIVALYHWYYQGSL